MQHGGMDGHIDRQTDTKEGEGRETTCRYTCSVCTQFSAERKNVSAEGNDK